MKLAALVSSVCVACTLHARHEPKQSMPHGTLLLPCSALAVTFSPDGKLLAFGDDKSRVRIWSVAGKEVDSWAVGKGEELYSIAFSADGTLLEARTWDSAKEAQVFQLSLWNVATQRRVFSREFPIGWPVAVSPDHKTLAYSSRNNTVHLWDVAQNKKVNDHVWGKDETVEHVSYGPNGKLLVVTNHQDAKRPQARLWSEGMEGTRELPFVLHRRLSATGTHWAGMIGLGPCLGGALLLGDVSTGRATPLLAGDLQGVGAPVFSADARWLAVPRVGQRDAVVQIWDVTHCKPLCKIGLAETLRAIAFAPDAKTMALAGAENCLLLSFVGFHGFGGSCAVLAVSPGGKLLAKGNRKGKVELSERATGKVLHTLASHDKEVQAISFSPDGRIFASADGDSVCLWNAGTAARLHRLPIKRLGMLELLPRDLPPDKKELAQRMFDGEVRRLEFSEDSATLLVDTSDACTWWDVKTGKEAEE